MTHNYAVCIAVDKNNISSSVDNLTACTLAVYDWLIQNLLSLNRDKSEAAIFRTQLKVESLSKDLAVSVADTPITKSDSIKSLGVTLDKNITYNTHISGI